MYLRMSLIDVEYNKGWGWRLSNALEIRLYVNYFDFGSANFNVKC